MLTKVNSHMQFINICFQVSRKEQELQDEEIKWTAFEAQQMIPTQYPEQLNFNQEHIAKQFEHQTNMTNLKQELSELKFKKDILDHKLKLAEAAKNDRLNLEKELNKYDQRHQKPKKIPDVYKEFVLQHHWHRESNSGSKTFSKGYFEKNPKKGYYEILRDKLNGLRSELINNYTRERYKWRDIQQNGLDYLQKKLELTLIINDCNVLQSQKKKSEDEEKELDQKRILILKKEAKEMKEIRDEQLIYETRLQEVVSVVYQTEKERIKMQEFRLETEQLMQHFNLRCEKLFSSDNQSLECCQDSLEKIKDYLSLVNNPFCEEINPLTIENISKLMAVNTFKGPNYEEMINQYQQKSNIKLNKMSKSQTETNKINKHSEIINNNNAEQ